jgi:hypothetical protein
MCQYYNPFPKKYIPHQHDSLGKPKLIHCLQQDQVLRYNKDHLVLAKMQDNPHTNVLE